jgi:hypothetical protein
MRRTPWAARSPKVSSLAAELGFDVAPLGEREHFALWDRQFAFTVARS